MNSLIEKFGPTVNLKAQPEFVNQLLKEALLNISENIGSQPLINREEAYSRNHERGYDKENYDRTYSQHDRSWE